MDDSLPNMNWLEKIEEKINRMQSESAELEAQKDNLTSEIEERTEKCGELTQKIKTQESAWKKLHKTMWQLDQEYCNLRDLRERQSSFIRILVEGTLPETEHILFLIDIYAELAGIKFSIAHEHTKELYTEFAPNRSFPTEKQLSKWRDLRKGWYNSHASPCFIKTMCDWYGRGEDSEIPLIFYRFIPGLQERLSEEFVDRHFYLFFTFKIGKRKGIIDLFLDQYVVYYFLKNDDTHMCVVSKEELTYLKDSDGLQSCKFSDDVLTQHIHEDPCRITKMILCLPRGNTSCLEDDGYKYKEFRSVGALQMFTCLCEPKYKVKITYKDKTQLDSTWNKGDDGKYDFEPSLSERKIKSITSVELYFLKGESPFK